MKLSVIMPIYNEKETIREIINRVKKVDLNKEIIVVDDCSTDGTREVLKKIKGVKVVLHKQNGGKGTAIRTGLKYVTGDIIVIQDGDLEVNPQEFIRLMECIKNGADVVYGSRMLGKSYKDLPLYYKHYLGNKLLNFITNLLYGCKITDMETCYKMIKTKIVKSLNLKAKRFDFEPEITSKILKRGYKIKEIPIGYNPRSFKEGKKINWKDGIKAALYLIKYRFFD